MSAHRKTRPFRTTLMAAGVITAVLALTGGTVAVAGNMVGSPQIKDGGVYGVDVHNNSLRSLDYRDKSVHANDLADRVRSRIDTTPITFDQLGSSPVPVEHIGGPIADNFTDTGLAMTLPKGAYVLDLSGVFQSTAAADPSVSVYPQLSLWFDHDGDDLFEWQTGEGGISPNALMPAAANRHITASGSQYVVLLKQTTVRVIAHGYTSTQGSERSGEIDVVQATLKATPVR